MGWDESICCRLRMIYLGLSLGEHRPCMLVARIFCSCILSARRRGQVCVRRPKAVKADLTCYSGLFLVGIAFTLDHALPSTVSSQVFFVSPWQPFLFFPIFLLPDCGFEKQQHVVSKFLCLPGDANPNLRGGQTACSWIRTRVWYPFLFLLYEFFW